MRRLIGQRVRLRLTPEVRFVYDDSAEEADLVVRVIGREEVERYRSEIEVRDKYPQPTMSGIPAGASLAIGICRYLARPKGRPSYVSNDCLAISYPPL